MVQNSGSVSKFNVNGSTIQISIGTGSVFLDENNNSYGQHDGRPADGEPQGYDGQHDDQQQPASPPLLFVRKNKKVF